MRFLNKKLYPLDKLISYEKLLNNKIVAINERDKNQNYNFLISDISNIFQYSIVSFYQHDINQNNFIYSEDSKIFKDKTIVDDCFNACMFHEMNNFQKNVIYGYRSNSLSESEKFNFDLIIDLYNVDSISGGDIIGIIHVYNRKGLDLKIGYLKNLDKIYYIKLKK